MDGSLASVAFHAITYIKIFRKTISVIRTTAIQHCAYYYFNFQISLLYSAMVLSDEKKPAFAIFTSIILFHF